MDEKETLIQIIARLEREKLEQMQILEEAKEQIKIQKGLITLANSGLLEQNLNYTLTHFLKVSMASIRTNTGILRLLNDQGILEHTCSLGFHDEKKFQKFKQSAEDPNLIGKSLAYQCLKANKIGVVENTDLKTSEERKQEFNGLTDKIIYVRLDELQFRLEQFKELEVLSAVYFPIYGDRIPDGKIIKAPLGVISIYSKEKKRFTVPTLIQIGQIANIVGKKIGDTLLFKQLEEQAELLRKQAETLRTLSETDLLTEMHNRRYFDARLAEEIARYKRDLAKGKENPLCLALIDIDHFKRYNDTYGHQEGDNALKAVAKELKKSLRLEDVAARWGGEEFALILPETNIGGAAPVVERLLNNIRQYRLTPEKEGEKQETTLTLSIGVMEYQNGMTQDDLIRHADQALYQSKDRGRNRITLYK